MKLPIKEDSREGRILQRATEAFGYTHAIDFVREAIESYYQVKITEQLEVAANFKKTELADNPDHMREVHQLQGIKHA